MIQLKSLVKAIQDASLSAVDHISNEHMKTLDKYFEEVEEVIELAEVLERLSKSVENSKLTKDDKDTIIGQSKSVSDLIKKLDDDTGKQKTKKLKPKTVTIQYPTETAEGFKTHDVHVPLMTLMPMALPQITELRFTTDLEISVDDNDDLKVSFPTKKKENRLFKNGDDDDKKSNATLEIVLNASNMSSGLQKIVEGYEKALRAQIPH